MSNTERIDPFAFAAEIPARAAPAESYREVLVRLCWEMFLRLRRETLVALHGKALAWLRRATLMRLRLEPRVRPYRQARALSIRISTALLLVSISAAVPGAAAQDTVVVRPAEIDDALTNPGIGFSTFQMFNGDNLEPNQDVVRTLDVSVFEAPNPELRNTGYPQTSLAYFRINWRHVEPEKDQYNWSFLDRILRLAHERGQTVQLRVSPYKWRPHEDVPDWYREMVGPEREFAHRKWVVDPEDPRYAKHFGDMIRDLAARYDGHPELESVDLSIVGWAGEGGGTELLSQETMKALMDAYLDGFRETPLVTLLHGKESVEYANNRSNVGWRQDCLGDLGFWADEQDGWTHMYDYYPRTIVEYDMDDAWERGPVVFEICADFARWKEREGYDLEDVEYIFDQALKWHISSFNAKSSPVPEEWMPAVNEWLKKMGYRFVLRRFSYPETVSPNEKLAFTSWWENKGVAPIYRKYPLALRLRNGDETAVLLTDADVREWLPGDNLYDGDVFVPEDLPEGEYMLELALVEPLRALDETPQPAVKLAIEGRTEDGWYRLGTIAVRSDGSDVTSARIDE